jgi:hypothetical protein
MVHDRQHLVSTISGVLGYQVHAIFTQSVFENYIPLAASLLYISSAFGLESGASPIRSKIISKPSPRLYARTTCVCRNVFGVSSFSIPVSHFNSSKIIRKNRSVKGNNLSSIGYFSRYCVYTAVNLAGNATLRSLVVCFPVCLIHS